MLILLCHELGHYFVARRHGVDASLPYFIPLPPGFGLGTLGAVIGMRQRHDGSQEADRRRRGRTAGGAGRRDPASSSIGLMHSRRRAALARRRDAEGNSILYALLKWLVNGRWLPTASATSTCTRRRSPAGRACSSR